MVCNDLAIANSSMGRYKEVSGNLDHVGRGGRLYFARVSCGHLREGLRGIQDIRGHRSLRALVESCTEGAQTAFADLCECLDGGKEHDDFKRCIGSVRNKVSFHYDEDGIEWALKCRAQGSNSGTSSMIAGEDIHSTRFEFADDLVDTLVCRKFWGIPADVDLRAEADRIADWCFRKTLRFLEFGQDFVPRYLEKHGILQ